MPFMINRAEYFRQFTTERTRQPVGFRFNVPFSIDPRNTESEIIQEHYVLGDEVRIEVPLVGQNEVRGFVRYRANLKEE